MILLETQGAITELVCHQALLLFTFFPLEEPKPIQYVSWHVFYCLTGNSRQIILRQVYFLTINNEQWVLLLVLVHDHRRLLPAVLYQLTLTICSYTHLHSKGWSGIMRVKCVFPTQCKYPGQLARARIWTSASIWSLKPSIGAPLLRSDTNCLESWQSIKHEPKYYLGEPLSNISARIKPFFHLIAAWCMCC